MPGDDQKALIYLGYTCIIQIIFQVGPDIGL